MGLEDLERCWIDVLSLELPLPKYAMSVIINKLLQSTLKTHGSINIASPYLFKVWLYDT